MNLSRMILEQEEGKGYRYNQQVLIDAIHDWTGNGETITEGKKIALVVTP